MPLVRIDLSADKPAAYRAAIAETTQSTMHAAFGVPVEERFQVVAEHAPGNIVIAHAHRAARQSSDAILIQITLNSGRDAGTKMRFHRLLADRLHDRLGVRREDVVINLVEVERQDWSFGGGEAQLAEPAGSAA